MAINFEQCLKRNLHLSHWAIIVYPKIDIIYCIAANLKISKIIIGYYLKAGNYMFKVNNRNTRERCEICSRLTIKTSRQRQWRRSGVFIINFEHISHLILVFLLLTLSR